MILRTRSGQFSSGQPIGILLLETSVPFIPGDVANASTYCFPVRFQKVEGFTVARALGRDPAVFEVLHAAARELVAQGVRAVTGDCGFMGIHQQRLAQQLGVPVFLSSLLQIPFIASLLGPSARVGVITADSRSLDAALLAAMGVADPQKVAVAGLQTRKNFTSFAIEETGTLDRDAVEAEVVEAARELVGRDSAVGALLLECSLLPPYAVAVQEAVGLPVFDYITMINYVFSAVVRRPYHGYM